MLHPFLSFLRMAKSRCASPPPVADEEELRTNPDLFSKLLHDFHLDSTQIGEKDTDKKKKKKTVIQREFTTKICK